MRLKKIFQTILVLIPVLMVSWHLYASNFQHLTRWKGNGYGMYTDSHGEYRSIVYRLEHNDSLLQVYPLGDEDYEKLSLEDKYLYSDSYKLLRLASFYPEWYEQKLKANLWLKSYLKNTGTLELYRTDLDLNSKQAKAVKVYVYE